MMKLGTENKTKTVIALVLAGLALLFLAQWMFDSGPSTAATAPPHVSAADGKPVLPRKQLSHSSDKKTIATTWTPSPRDPRLELKSLESTQAIEYKGSGRNIFQMTVDPIIEKPIGDGLIKQGSKTSAPIVQTGPPAPPPINLKFYGFATKTGGQKSVFLLQDGSVFIAREGDIIARRYKVVRINASSVEIQDMLSNNKQTIALTAG